LARRLDLAANTLFLGYLDRAHGLADCYAAADMFTFASRTETQGLVLLEAMAAGVPVVALAEMGTRDILGPGRGALVPEADPADFAAAVGRLLDDEALRKRLGEEARTWSRQWSDDAMSERLSLFYRELGFAGRQTQAASPAS
jgi:glycosyltransferase involved in cell wall biosynthesis